MFAELFSSPHHNRAASLNFVFIMWSAYVLDPVALRGYRRTYKARGSNIEMSSRSAVSSVTIEIYSTFTASAARIFF